MRKTSLGLLVSTLVLSSVLGLAACGGNSLTKEDTVAAATANGIIIDVRTADEFGGGHVEGAVNYDVESGVFAGQLGTLDKSASYFLYCRSGRRSAIAADMMKSAGFTRVTDLGAMEDAAAALKKNIVQ